MPKSYPTLEYENALRRAGHLWIAGLDEAGRGAWAGPVAAAAVILPPDDPALGEKLRDVCDSKLCTPHQRDVLYEQIAQTALAWSVALVAAGQIDQIGIVAATRQAMQEAVARLDPPPTALLIDYLRLPAVHLPQQAIKHGDRLCLSIAAASIMAKVTRDRELVRLDALYPGYGLAVHKGYGTSAHRAALERLGPSPIHRRSFAPVAAIDKQRSSYEQAGYRSDF